MKIYFFGCLTHIGHHLWTPEGKRVNWPHGVGVPASWAYYPGSLDQRLCPGDAEQRQGIVRVHHTCGWTAMGWWDRSLDTRHGANAALLADADLRPHQMIAEGLRAFPRVFARFTYSLRLEHSGEVLWTPEGR